MSAQINLYHDEFRAKVTRFSLALMLQLTAFTAVVLVMLSATDIWHIYQLKTDINRLENEQAVLDQERNSLKTQYGTQHANPGLAEKIADYEIIIANLVPLQQLIRESGFASGQGYSHYLVALARQRQPGMWFDSIHINGAGHGFALEGQTRSAQLLPEYIQSLSKESLLAGTEFSSLHMKQADAGEDTNHHRILQFSMATENTGRQASP